MDPTLPPSTLAHTPPKHAAVGEAKEDAEEVDGKRVRPLLHRHRVRRPPHAVAQEHDGGGEGVLLRRTRSRGSDTPHHRDLRREQDDGQHRANRGQRKVHRGGGGGGGEEATPANTESRGTPPVQR